MKVFFILIDPWLQKAHILSAIYATRSIFAHWSRFCSQNCIITFRSSANRWI